MMGLFVSASLSLAVLVASLTPAYSQTPQPQPQNPADDVIRLNTELVVLDAQVLDNKTRRIVSGLRKEDFKLYEDGVMQKITYFSYDQRPLSIVLLFQTLGTAQWVIDEMQKAALATLNRLKPEDEVAVVAFTNEIRLAQVFTQDRQRVVDQLAKLKDNAYVADSTLLSQLNGFSCIGESIYQTDLYLQESARPLSRRAMIVVTENYPIDAFPPHSKGEITRQLLGSGTVVFGLVADSSLVRTIKTLEMLPPNMAGKMVTNAIFGTAGKVNTYAKPTAGQVMRAGKEQVIVRLTELITLLREQYSLGYTPTNTRADGRFRRIKVRLTPQTEKRLGGVAIRTREGYYARKKPGGTPKQADR